MTEATGERATRLLRALLMLCLLGGSCNKPAGVPPQRAEDGQPSLQEQKLCADQALKVFNEQKDETLFRNSFTNHYDPTGKICYVEISSMYVKKSEMDEQMTIQDAFEGRSYGFYFNATDTKAPATNDVSCYVTPRGSTKISCKDRDEFNSLALKYFGTTPD